MKFRPTKLLTTVRPFAASNNTRSAAKSHFAFQPDSEFAKAATARASRVAVSLKGVGFSCSILTPSGKLVAMRIQSCSEPRFGEAFAASIASAGELSPADKATGAAHEALQVSPAGATVLVRSRSSREPLSDTLS